jgi:hypothetical protein
MDLDVGGMAVSIESADNSWVGNGFEGGSRMDFQVEMVGGKTRQGSTMGNGGHDRTAARKKGGSHIQDSYLPVADGQDSWDVRVGLYCSARCCFASLQGWESRNCQRT